MAIDNFQVAIEIGSSKVTAVAGRKQPDGAIQILAFAQEPSTAFVRKGRINKVEKMTQCIISMKEKLEQKTQMRISRVYVGVGGMSMHTMPNTIVRHFDSRMEITQEIIDSMIDENRSSANAERDILESVPQEYNLGTQVQLDPVGILSDKIEGHYLNIVASSRVKEEIRECFRAVPVTVADLPITVHTLADAMLTESEKRSGCVFVDMGAETTSVAVYKNNLLRHLAVIPLGGANVNRDITSLQIEDDEAEELKLKYGTAITSDEEVKSGKPINLRDGRTIPYEEFIGLVESRVEEIILNVKNQIQLSGYGKNQLIGGLIITGGVANMKNIDKAFMEDTEFDKIRFVRNLRIPLRSPDYPGLNTDGDCNAAIALLDKAQENCCGGALGQPALFNDDEEEKEEKAPTPTPEELAQAEAAKKEAEEAERRLHEEEERIKAEAELRAREIEEKKRRSAERKANIKRAFGRIGAFFGNMVKEDNEN